MAETATQPLTQPAATNQPRGAVVSKEDEADIVCILHPTTPAAYEAVELVATTCPQHILQNAGLSRNLDDDPDSSHEGMETRPNVPSDQDGDSRREQQGADTEESGTHGPHAARPSTTDIAIRFSSKVNDMSLGWVFGRNPSRCDLLLAKPDDNLKTDDPKMKISNSHFRIFFNDNGILMLEDVSTNGTWLNNYHLQRKSDDPQHKSRQSRRTLEQGDEISILLPDNLMRFVLKVPRRDQAIAKYNRNVNEYLALVRQLEYRKAMAIQAATQGGRMPPPAVSHALHLFEIVELTRA